MTSEQKNRYHRHILLEEIGLDGQERLLQSRVLIIGAGGLGSPVAMYLAAAGVGTIGLADGDVVSLSNLQRQIIHNTSDLGRKKVLSARDRIIAMNPDVHVEIYDHFITEDTIEALVQQYDFIVDATDNPSIKYLINDACVMSGKPFTMGGISRFEGQLMTHVPGSACYRCIFPEPSGANEQQNCTGTGVLGSIAGICGTLQATEVIKYLTGMGELLTNTLLTFDARTMQFIRFEFNHNTDCPLCGINPTIHELREYAFLPCSKKRK